MNHPNIRLLERAAQQLIPLLDKLVFVGGSITGLLITDPAAAPVRSTKDVDTIVEISTRAAYYKLAEELRELGFKEDVSPDAPTCRWLHSETILDVMPTDANVLGFSNRWYETALQETDLISLESTQIKIVKAPVFLATKLEAFHDRGQDDLFSHDLEDVLVVIDGRTELKQEILNAPAEIRAYLQAEFSNLLSNQRFLELLPGLIGDSSRESLVLERLKQFVAG
jgi:predicted nucleotidyltransferase